MGRIPHTGSQQMLEPEDSSPVLTWILGYFWSLPRGNIDTNDFNTKLNHAIKFLKDGNKVKVSVRFRGREMAHPELGTEMVQKFAEGVAEFGSVDKMPKLEGRSMVMIISSKTGK